MGMTEQIAIECLEYLLSDCVYIKEYVHSRDFLEASSVIRKVLEEIQQYRAIGTVEELQALKEKSVAMKLIEQGTDDKTIYKCSCGNVLLEKYSDGYMFGYITDYCSECGQKLLRCEADYE